jgi:hypothetical protein
MKKIVEYNPVFPIEEIKRANAALEKGTGIMWRRSAWNGWVEEEATQLSSWSDSTLDTNLTQLDGDWFFTFSKKKSKHDYLLELKHQNSLSLNEHQDLITCYVSKKWMDNYDNPQYPRMAYGICLPRENTLYYCNTLKSAIKKAVKESKAIKHMNGKYLITVPKNSFKKVGRKVTKKDLATWNFVQQNGIKIYGRKQNYFEPEEEATAPIDKLIARKKLERLEIMNKMDAEIAELEEHRRRSKLLSDKHGEDL